MLIVAASQCRQEWQAQQTLRSGALQSIAHLGRCDWDHTGEWVPASAGSHNANCILRIENSGGVWLFNADAQPMIPKRLPVMFDYNFVPFIGSDDLLHIIHGNGPRIEGHRHLQAHLFDPRTGAMVSGETTNFCWPDDSFLLTSRQHHQASKQIIARSDNGEIVILHAEALQKQVSIPWQANSAVSGSISCLKFDLVCKWEHASIASHKIC